jgi:hypothetical protein
MKPDPLLFAPASSSDDLAGRPHRASVHNGTPITLRQDARVIEDSRRLRVV